MRKDKELLARLPLRRTGEIIFLGEGAVSTKLLRRCAELRIPVSFCSAGGWYSGTYKPDSKLYFQRVAAHAARHEALGENGRLAAARAVVESKLRNHRQWFLSLPGEAPRAAAGALLVMARELEKSQNVDSLRGAEGQAARLAFATLRGLVRREGFEAAARIPREKPDRLNALLDFLYSLLFTRLNVLLRGYLPVRA